MNEDAGANDLAVVVITETEFEAQTKAAVLRGEGIETMVTVNAPSWTGRMSISPTARGASVLVRREDLERARRLLDETLSDSVDLDWDEVDVGEREDTLPLHPVNRMPLLAKVGFAVALVILIMGAAVFIFILLGLFAPDA